MTTVFGLTALAGAAAGLQLVTTLPDIASAPAGANGDSYLPVTSPDGRYLLFASGADNLVPTNNSGSVPNTALHYLNVFLRNRAGGTTTLVSVNPQGNGGNGNSFPVAISTNGQFALFESTASDLVVGDGNRARDIFVRDLVQGTTMLVSVATNGTSGNGNSRNADMTPDGRYVTFVSDAANLVPGDTNGIADVFVRDLQAGVTTLASVGAVSNVSPTGVTGSGSPVMTPDGRYVVFDSTATGLVPGVSSSGEVYVRDLVGGTTTWASTNAQNIFQSVYGTPNMFSGHADISADGRFVAFEACTTNLAVFNGAGIVLRYDLQTGTTDIVCTNANAPLTSPLENINSLGITPDGRFIVYVANEAGTSDNTAIFLWDSQTGTNILVSADQTTGLPVTGNCDAPVVTPDGRFVAFISNGTNLTANVLDASTNTLPDRYHLYCRDTMAGTTQLIDADTNNVGIKVDSQTVPAMTDDGGWVFFDRIDGSLAPNDWNRDSDVFGRNTTNGLVELISAHYPASPSKIPNGFSTLFSTSVSATGRYIAFSSDANNLSPNDTNGFRDVFVRDLLLGTNIPVSVTTNGLFSTTNGSSEPSISSNGRFVAFTAGSSGLVLNDRNGASDVFIRDLQNGTTMLVSSNWLGVFGTTANADSFGPILSSDGRYVLFHSKADNLNSTLPSNTRIENLYLFDSQLLTNYSLTAGTTGAGVTSAAMTSNGRYVVFVGQISGSSANNLYVWDAQALKRVYTNTSAPFGSVAISPDGHWIVYVGNATFASSLTLNAFDLINRTNIQFYTGALPSQPGLQFSADGRFFVYAIQGGGVNYVYLRDFQTGAISLVSENFSGNPANGSSDAPVISADGRYIAYRSVAGDIVPIDTNGVGDVFLYDRSNNATMLVTANRSGAATANNWSLLPVFSGDGSTLVFESYASDLDPLFNEYSAIYAMSLAVPAIVDTDGDGMDDAWEMNHFGTLARDGTGDFDGDGASDLFEFLTGTDPTDPNSLFRATITGSLTPGQTPTVNWPLAPGKSYRVQFKNDLGDLNWQDVSGPMTFEGTKGRIADLTPATGRRFYRIVQTN